MLSDGQESGSQPSTGLTAAVIGAAGRTGQNFATALRRHGVETLLADTDEIGLARLRQDGHPGVLRADVLVEHDLNRLFEAGEARFGGIDLLINTAGRGYVRALATKQASRSFLERPRRSLAFVVNVGADDVDDDASTYVSSQVAFETMAADLADATEDAQVRMLSLHRLESPVAIADLVEQLVRELRQSRDVNEDGAGLAIGS